MNQANNANAAESKSTENTQQRRSKIVQASLIGATAIVAGALYWSLAPHSEEATEDAYVDGNVVQVTPQIAGIVTLIGADNTDFVKAGQPLVKFNAVDADLALARSEAQLA